MRAPRFEPADVARETVAIGRQPGDHPLLSVEALSVEFGTSDDVTRAVSDLSFSLFDKSTLAIVGESGSGKSVSSLALLGLVHHLGGRLTGGRLTFQSDVHGRAVDLAALDEPGLRAVRGNEIAMIFQEPMSSLNPVFTIGSQIVETLRLHRGHEVRSARAQGARARPARPSPPSQCRETARRAIPTSCPAACGSGP